MAEMLGTDDLLSIGRFARLSGLTVKALRHYDEIGLLRPARVDDASGYRYYALSQAREAEAIRRLRALDVPLEEVAPLIGAQDETVRGRLAVHRARIEGRAVEVQAILAELDRLIDGEEELVPTHDKVQIRFEIDIKHVPERRVAVVRERVQESAIKEVIPRQIMAVGHYLQEIGAQALGPPLCVCPFADGEGMLALETGWPVGDDVPPRPPIEVKTYPATRALIFKHVGPFDGLGRAYRLMSEVMEHHGLEPAADPVEIYETDPAEVADPNEYVTFIEWPIGDGGTWPPAADVLFHRRVE
jgi:DNA-binding transcriptional MerR regulator